MHVSDLFIYPLKSARGIRLDASAIDAFGLPGDRRAMVVDNTGRFITQREMQNTDRTFRRRGFRFVTRTNHQRTEIKIVAIPLLIDRTEDAAYIADHLFLRGSLEVNALLMASGRFIQEIVSGLSFEADHYDLRHAC